MNACPHCGYDAHKERVARKQPIGHTFDDCIARLSKQRDEAAAKVAAIVQLLKEFQEEHTCFCDYYTSQLSDYAMEEHDDFCVRMTELIKSGGNLPPFTPNI